MLRIAILYASLVASAVHPVQAQDIAGVEDCTKPSGLDKRTGCLQSNVNILQQLLTRHSLDARQRIDALVREVIALKSKVASLQASVDQLQAAQKAPEKKPDAK